VDIAEPLILSGEDELSDPGPIAEVDERQRPEIAAAIDPSREPHLPADIGRAQLSTIIRSHDLRLPGNPDATRIIGCCVPGAIVLR